MGNHLIKGSRIFPRKLLWKMFSRMVRSPCNPVSTRRCSTPRVDSVKSVTGHEKADNWASRAKFTTRKNILRLATWNVRGLNQQGKLQIVQEELNRCSIDVACISEVHWQGQGHFRTSDYTMYFSGAEDRNIHGVGMLVSNKLNNFVLGYEPINERVMSLKLNARPCIINIMSLYAPTLAAEDDVVEEFYRTVEAAINKIPSKEILLLMGDFNAKIGSTLNDDHNRRVVGKFGLGVRNERGERLIQFCIDNGFTITNSMFQHHKRRLYTWTSPDGHTRNQIDYILIRQRWKSSVKIAKTLPSADCGSDHQLLICESIGKLKVCKRRQLKQLPKLSADRVEAFNESAMQKIEASLVEPEAVNVEVTWQAIKQSLISTLEEMPPVDQVAHRQPWLSAETRQLIQERRIIKSRGLDSNIDRERYQSLNRAIQTATRRDINTYLMNICTEIQNHAVTNNSRDLFKKISSITRKFKPRHWAVKDRDDNLATELDKIAVVWKDYCENLYADPNAIVGNLGNYDQEPDILLEEVEAAINKLREGKAVGLDRVSAEVIKALDERGVKFIHRLCQQIWRTGVWPEDWSTSVMQPLHKKGSTTVCDNHRLIALISHCSKVMLYILQARLNAFLVHQIAPEQAGFVKGRGTREQILNARQLIEKAREYSVPMYLCFVDYEKAFDNVRWPKLWKTLEELGVPLHLISLVKNLYDASEAVVKIDNTLSDKCRIRKGVRQGCVLSPLLYNVYSEVVMRSVLESWDGGVKIGGKRFSNLRFADDTLLIAGSPEELQEILHRLQGVSLEYGLKININKTKIMIIDRDNENQRQPEKIGDFEVVDKFVYLGSMLHKSGSCEFEVRRRIEIARTAMIQLTKIWKNRNITRNTKINLVNALVFPVFFYGSETWVIRSNDRKRIDAFEMWVWRRMLRVPWTARRTNVSILNEIKPVQRVSSRTYGRILKFFGHISRHDNMEKLVVQGRPEGKRKRGRSPTRWTDAISKLTESNISSAARQANNRGSWKTTVRRIVQNLDRPPP